MFIEGLKRIMRQWREQEVVKMVANTPNLGFVPTAGAFRSADYEIADALNLSGELELAIPYWDYVDEMVYYDTQLMNNMKSGGGFPIYLPTNDCQQLIYAAALANQRDPVWSRTWDPLHFDQFFHEGGEAIYGSQKYNRVQITLVDTDRETDYWWGSYNFAKFGIYSFGNSDGYFKPQKWWNFPNQNDSTDGIGGGDRFYINSKKGTTAIINLHPPLSPPPIFYNIDGEAWTKFHIGKDGPPAGAI